MFPFRVSFWVPILTHSQVRSGSVSTAFLRGLGPRGTSPMASLVNFEVLDRSTRPNRPRHEVFGIGGVDRLKNQAYQQKKVGIAKQTGGPFVAMAIDWGSPGLGCATTLSTCDPKRLRSFPWNTDVVCGKGSRTACPGLVVRISFVCFKDVHPRCCFLKSSYPKHPVVAWKIEGFWVTYSTT